MSDGGLSRLDKTIMSIDFFEEERILSNKEARDIKLYLAGEGVLVGTLDSFDIDSSECPMKD